MSIDVYWLLLPESTINLTMHTQFVLWAPLVYACTMCMCVYSLVRSLSRSFTHSFVRLCVRPYVYVYVCMYGLDMPVYAYMSVSLKVYYILVKLNWWVCMPISTANNRLFCIVRQNAMKFLLSIGFCRIFRFLKKTDKIKLILFSARSNIIHSMTLFKLSA